MRHEILHTLGACSDAISWAETFDTLQAAWDVCERGDWMFWLVGRVSGPVGSASRRKCVLVATKCARLAWPHVREQDRPVVQACYDACEAYGLGDPTVFLDDVRRAARAVWAAARVAADAAVAAEAAARVAAEAAARAAVAAVAAWGAVAAVAAEAAVLKQCADILRKHYPIVPLPQEAGQ